MNLPCRISQHPNRATLTRAVLAVLLGLVVVAAPPAIAQAVTPAFTYQGELRTGGSAANASFDMEFRLYNADAGGSQVGAPVTRTNVAAVNGLFAVQLDFGPSQFAGDRQWLEVRIKPAGSGSYETLSPRTEVTAAPYALGAVAALANSVTSTSIVDGSIRGTDISTNEVQRRVTGSCPSGQYVRVVNQDGTVTCDIDVRSSGSVTSVATGAGLTGGPITTDGTISVAAGGIGNTEINAAQVQRRIGGNCQVGEYIRVVNQDGSVSCGTDATGSGWSLGGNAGTNPATQFIGTTDAQPFVVRTRNVQSLRIEPSAELFGGVPITANVIAGSSANSVTPGVRGATIAGGGVPTGDSDPDFAGEAANRVTDAYGTVGGGYANRAGNGAGTIGDGGFGTVGGGILNTASGIASTVGGGEANTAGESFGTIGGGFANTATGFASSVAGGNGSAASGQSSTVGGGFQNTASSQASTVAGGSGNTASGQSSTVAGGFMNAASGGQSTVGGGASNRALGYTASVTGGQANCAGGDYSSASGSGARVRPASDPGTMPCTGFAAYPGGSGDQGTFVWADSQGVNFDSSGSNQFLVRAAGGAVITGSSANNTPLGNRLRVDGTLRVDSLGAAGVTTLCRNVSNQIATCSSSARYKSDIADLDLGLDAVLQLRAVGYRWKDGGAADVGFVAEEIAVIDERLVTRNGDNEIEGVKYDRLTAVLANAVQELAARDSLAAEALAKLERENAALREGQTRLAAELAELRAMLDANRVER